MMNARRISGFLNVLAILFGPGTAAAENPLGSSFTYQGQLQYQGAPANGNYEFQFKLYDAFNGGNPVGNPNTVTSGEQVINGLLTVALNFGGEVFTGYERYLEIGVRPEFSPDPFTILSPRQRLLPAPYAFYALEAGEAGSVPWVGVTDKPAGFGDGVDNDTTYTAGSGLTLSGTQFAVNTTAIQARVTGTCAVGSSIRTIRGDATVDCETDDNSGGTVTAITAGTGLTGGTITGHGAISVDFGSVRGTVSEGGHSHDTRYWRTDGNTTGPDIFLGTTFDHPLEFRVNNQRALLLDASGESINTIGGVSANSNTGGTTGATIGGGGRVGGVNRVTDNYGTVGGGYGNQAGDGLLPVTTANAATVSGGIGNTAGEFAATVGGGSDNEASASDATVAGGHLNVASDTYSTVAGGYENAASDTAATVAGGHSNAASGSYATVGGGRDNAAGGDYATVCGGSANSAAANYSFAAGRRAKANHAGAFVWADSSNFDFASGGSNTFRVRATNGVRFVVGVDGSGSSTWSCAVFDGDGAWSCSSDRNLKENLTRVDGHEILQRLSRVPIQEWNAKGQDPSVRHLGPVAQDFHAAFGLGRDDTSISTIDLDGVALAAIQGLHELLQEKEAAIARLEERVAALERAAAH